MGLDMYLEHVINPEKYEKHGVIQNIDLKDVTDFKSNQLVYWRKANQIHAFFEDKLADGHVGNCNYYNVPIYVLEELVELCREVLSIGKRVNYDGTLLNPREKDKIDALLPTRAGFFFGSTDYNEYYFNDLEDTIDKVEPVINRMKSDPEYGVWYYSWW